MIFQKSICIGYNRRCFFLQNTQNGLTADYDSFVYYQESSLTSINIIFTIKKVH